MATSKILEETALRLERLSNIFKKWRDYHSGRADSVTAQTDAGSADAYMDCAIMLEEFVVALRSSEADLADQLLDFERRLPNDDEEDDA